MILELGKRIDVDSSWTLVMWGKSTHRKLAIGSVRTLATAAIVFRDPSGQQTVITEEQAREIEEAFSVARLGARMRREHLSGFDRPQVTRAGSGDPIVLFRGRAREMRLSDLRRPRRCRWCDADSPQMWVAKDDPKRAKGQNRERHTELCPSCLDRIEHEPKGARAVANLGDRR
jgi:hypothetical protein